MQNSSMSKVLGAKVLGQVTSIPKDLYIPPDALCVLLETFEGPLDLLLYLIKRQNIDILNLPIAEITRQYMAYVEVMHKQSLELTAEYLVMAAILAEIKSRMLLPRPQATEQASEEDPRTELVRRLQIYEGFKKAAQMLDELPQLDRDVFRVHAGFDNKVSPAPPQRIELDELLKALNDVLQRSKVFVNYKTQRDVLSVSERVDQLMEILKQRKTHEFTSLLNPAEGRLGVVVTFLALLELLRQMAVEFLQNEPFSPIYLMPIHTQCSAPTKKVEAEEINI